MSSPGLRRKYERGSSRAPLLLVLLIIVAGGVLAYRHFFNRAGEAAIQLIPQDASLVVTLDTNPSPDQVSAFNRIKDAIKTEKLDSGFDEMLTGMFSNSKFGQEMRP